MWAINELETVWKNIKPLHVGLTVLDVYYVKTHHYKFSYKLATLYTNYLNVILSLLYKDKFESK
jgi:hypothetical protein